MKKRVVTKESARMRTSSEPTFTQRELDEAGDLQLVKVEVCRRNKHSRLYRSLQPLMRAEYF